MRKRIFFAFAALGFLSACERIPGYEYYFRDDEAESRPTALIVDGVFMMEAIQTENTCFAGGLVQYSEPVPFVFTADSEGELIPGDAILLFDDNPIVAEGVSFDFHVPLRQEDGEWLGLVVWHPDDEITMLMYSGDFSGEGDVANFHEATIVLEYASWLCESGNYGTTVTKVQGWRK